MPGEILSCGCGHWSIAVLPQDTDRGKDIQAVQFGRLYAVKNSCLLSIALISDLNGRLCIDADGSRTTLQAGDSLVNVFISPLKANKLVHRIDASQGFALIIDWCQESGSTVMGEQLQQVGVNHLNNIIEYPSKLVGFGSHNPFLLGCRDVSTGFFALCFGMCRCSCHHLREREP